MQIDSTPLDVAVDLDDGVVGRVELTALVHIATRSIPAAVIRPTTKAVDASLLLARCLTPELMRPGWAEAASMAASALPFRSPRTGASSEALPNPSATMFGSKAGRSSPAAAQAAPRKNPSMRRWTRSWTKLHPQPNSGAPRATDAWLHGTRPRRMRKCPGLSSRLLPRQPAWTRRAPASPPLSPLNPLNPLMPRGWLRSSPYRSITPRKGQTNGSDS